MPRYVLDIHDGTHIRDDIGVECDNLRAVALEARKLLPAVPRDEVSKDGEHRAVTVLVINEDGKPVYSAALTYTGIWLLR